MATSGESTPPQAEAIPETQGRLPSTHYEDHHLVLPDILDRIETLEEKSEKPLMHLQDMVAGGVKLVDIGGRCEALEGKVTELRERIPAGTGIIGLKEDIDAALQTAEHARDKASDAQDRLDDFFDTLQTRQKQIDDWGVVFSELVARISVLEGVVLKLTLGEATQECPRCGYDEAGWPPEHPERLEK